jgi:hypothetical protein
MALSGRAALSIAAVIAIGLLAGCSATGTSNSADVGAAVVPQPAAVPFQNGAKQPAQGQSSGSGSAAKPQSGQANPAATLPPVGRQIIRSASIALAVSDVKGTVAQAQYFAIEAGGYTGTEDAGPDHASLTLQVPESALDSVLDKLARQPGVKVTSRTEQSQDVTNQLVDVRSRIDTQQASVDRVRALLANAASLADIVSIEGELTRREADLESLQQQRAELSGQVAMSAVTVDISRSQPVPAAVVAPRSSGFVGGLTSGWHAFVGALGVLLLIVGAALPFVLLLGIPVGVWWGLRRRKAGRSIPVSSATE